LAEIPERFVCFAVDDLAELQIELEESKQESKLLPNYA